MNGPFNDLGLAHVSHDQHPLQWDYAGINKIEDPCHGATRLFLKRCWPSLMWRYVRCRCVVQYDQHTSIEFKQTG